jgi:MFS family permease
MPVAVVLFAVFALTMANTSVYATLGLFARSVGLSEVQVGAIFASSGLLFFLTGSRWGRFSDRRGRRPVIVIGLAATASSVFLFAGLFTLHPGDAGVAELFIALLSARLLYGLLAGGAQPAAMAYMADITTATTRATGVAWVGAAVGLGSIVGPMAAAWLVGFSFSAPLVVGGAIAGVAAALALVAIADVRPAHQAAPAAAGRPAGALPPHAVIAFLLYFGFSALQPTTAFFVQDLFGIDMSLAAQRASLISATFAGSAFVVQAFGVRRLGLVPHRLLSFGTMIALMGIVGCLLASDFPWLLVAFGVAGIGYGLAQPGLMAVALLAADSDRQGELAGRLHAAMSAAWIVGPLAGTAVYALDVRAPLVLAAGALLALLIPRPAPSARRA